MQIQKFQELVDKFLDESASIEEKRQLATFLEDPSYLALLDDMVIAQLAAHTYEFEPDEEIQRSIDQYIDQKTLPVHGGLTHRARFLRKWGWAAAAVIVLGVAAYIWTTSEKSVPTLTNNSKQLQKDIPPGSEKAMLTLADGSTVMLDSASNGKLAQQGNASIVKLADGDISYQPAGASTGDVLMNTMSTPRGGQYRLTLPDGSKAWLNAASSISYPVTFVGNKRKVSVKGEVYFEIVKNAQKPFIVDINGESSIEVLGTDFNINSYSDESNIKTTLVEGSVRVVKAGAGPLILHPGQQARISSNSVTLHEGIDVEEEIAWKNGLFIFNKIDIKSVMRQISRWYDVDVIYDDPALDKRYMAEISRDLPISKVLRLLELTSDVHFKIEGKKIIVSK